MSEKLYVGVSRQDITPNIGGRLFGYLPDLYSTDVNDNLTLTTFALCQGDTKALMISVSVGNIKTDLAKEMRNEIKEKFGVDFNNIIISATHTHTGPCVYEIKGWGDVDEEYYFGILKPAVIKSAKDALNNTKPAKVAFFVGESKVGINRRQLKLENRVSLGQNPWGPYNPDMTVISFKDENDKIIGNMIHYGCHGTSAGQITTISRDWPGIMTDQLEKASGGLTAFFNGPEGDVGPRISNGKTTGEDIKYVYELGKKAAEDAISIYNKITEYKDVNIMAKTGILKLPLKPRISLEEALKGIESFNGNMFNISLKSYDYYNKVKESYDTDYKEKEFREVEQTLIKIGDIVFASFPYELFSEIGMRINNGAEGIRVLSLSNANGSENYFPTQDQLCRGGYEINMFKYSDVQNFVDDADFHLIKETLRNIKELNNE